MRSRRPQTVPAVTTAMSPSPDGLGMVRRDALGIVVAP
jgi:hypothetical protein